MEKTTPQKVPHYKNCSLMKIQTIQSILYKNTKIFDDSRKKLRNCIQIGTENHSIAQLEMMIRGTLTIIGL